MEFTYGAYERLLGLLREKGYFFCDYHNYAQRDKSVILRHDIDMDIDMAVQMASLEERAGVRSTYFVLLSSNFYNVFSGRNQRNLGRILEMGHEVGLHFDEAKYDFAPDDMVTAIEEEVSILERCLGCEVATVSMHRPSQATLEADYRIRGGRVVNSYGKVFFRDHKYVSDSRRRWREDVEAVTESGAYDRLHILTHPFWYGEHERSAKEVLRQFVRSRADLCYADLRDNIRDIEEFLREEEIF